MSHHPLYCHPLSVCAFSCPRKNRQNVKDNDECMNNHFENVLASAFDIAVLVLLSSHLATSITFTLCRLIKISLFVPSGIILFVLSLKKDFYKVQFSLVGYLVSRIIY